MELNKQVIDILKCFLRVAVQTSVGKYSRYATVTIGDVHPTTVLLYAYVIVPTV